MLHTVEVGSFRDDVIAAFSNMMTWLDTRGSQPVILQEAAGRGTAFRLRFSTEAEALAFVWRSAAGWSAKCPRVSPSGCADPNRVTDCRLQPPQSQRILAPIARR
jgi:hypothetical protein